jgi:Fe-S oxidoreductase
MQTNFSIAQLKNPATAEAEKILRACVHCGFCTPICPTFLLLGDELDSPRGRIYLIKEMLEKNKSADETVVKHIDRCLSCLSCMTACPSGVNYMHLVDHARSHIEATYKRPLADRLLRAFLGFVLPHPNRFRLALAAAPLAKPFQALLPRLGRTGRRLAAMMRLAPISGQVTLTARRPAAILPARPAKGRVALLRGCVQQVIGPEINGAAIRLHSACSLQHGQQIDAVPKELLRQAGFKVRDVPEGHLCCGSAGTYNILEPEIALRLRDRKLENIMCTSPDVIAAGNIGCIAQLASATSIPVLHTIELLDFAHGGPEPACLSSMSRD